MTTIGGATTPSVLTLEMCRIILQHSEFILLRGEIRLFHNFNLCVKSHLFIYRSNHIALDARLVVARLDSRFTWGKSINVLKFALSLKWSLFREAHVNGNCYYFCFFFRY